MRSWIVERSPEQWADYYVTVGRFEGAHPDEGYGRFATGGWNYISTAVKQPPEANGHPLLEDCDLWFEFGRSVDEALARLKQSLSH